MRDKIKNSAKEAIAQIGDGASLMVGGFMGVGTPESLIDALVEKGVKNLTIICNDGGWGNPDKGIGKLISKGQVKKLIASHVGLNPEVGRRMSCDNPDEKMEVVLVPQGTLIEQIRAGGSGLGGVLTPTGVGTLVAEGKQVLNIDGKDYLLEKPLKADFGLIRASKADKFGNCVFYGTTRNFNPLIPAAVSCTIAGAQEIVEAGELDPNSIHVSGIFVDIIVGGEK
ncbi:MAG: CoA transferase subunit A [Spirochaetes bacterium]|nr:CoA transferase subunit A [Spirochaetota bacterium]